MAMLGKEPKVGLAFGKNCTIRLDGLVETLVRNNGRWRLTPIGTVQGLRDDMRRLADHCKLTDKDREAMFAELSKWILKDERATSTGELRVH